MSTTLDGLLYDCTVKLKLSGGTTCGTGFFVAPGYVLTCEHVVRHAGEQLIDLRWRHQEDFAKGRVEAKCDKADIALVRFEPPHTDLPCVYFDSRDVEVREALYCYGYPSDLSKPDEYPDGCPVIGVSEGFIRESPPLIKLRAGQFQPGMSGAALLNLSTGKVCGMVKFTRDKHSDLGGGGIKASTILERFPQLKEWQEQFHEQDSQWQRLLRLPWAIPDVPPNTDDLKNWPDQAQITEWIKQVTDCLNDDQASVIFIIGRPGSGKSQLAAKAIEGTIFSERFRQHWSSFRQSSYLHTFQSWATVALSRFGQSTQRSENADEDLSNLLVSLFLDSAPLLFVLDGVEKYQDDDRAWSAFKGFIRQFLQANTYGGKIIVTSRIEADFDLVNNRRVRRIRISDPPNFSALDQSQSQKLRSWVNETLSRLVEPCRTLWYCLSVFEFPFIPRRARDVFDENIDISYFEELHKRLLLDRPRSNSSPDGLDRITETTLLIVPGELRTVARTQEDTEWTSHHRMAIRYYESIAAEPMRNEIEVVSGITLYEQILHHHLEISEFSIGLEKFFEAGYDFDRELYDKERIALYEKISNNWEEKLSDFKSDLESYTRDLEKSVNLGQKGFEPKRFCDLVNWIRLKNCLAASHSNIGAIDQGLTEAGTAENYLIAAENFLKALNKETDYNLSEVINFVKHEKARAILQQGKLFLQKDHEETESKLNEARSLFRELRDIDNEENCLSFQIDWNISQATNSNSEGNSQKAANYCQRAISHYQEFEVKFRGQQSIEEEEERLSKLVDLLLDDKLLPYTHDKTLILLSHLERLKKIYSQWKNEGHAYLAKLVPSMLCLGDLQFSLGKLPESKITYESCLKYLSVFSKLPKHEISRLPQWQTRYIKDIDAGYRVRARLVEIYVELGDKECQLP